MCVCVRARASARVCVWVGNTHTYMHAYIHIYYDTVLGGEGSFPNPGVERA